MASHFHDTSRSRYHDYDFDQRMRRDSRLDDSFGRRHMTEPDEMNNRRRTEERYTNYDTHSRPDSRPSHSHYYHRSSSRSTSPPPPPHSQRLRPRPSPPPLHTTNRSSSRRSPYESRRQWPPPPKVEEEKAALAREYKPRQIKHDDEAPSRGAIDQDPIILEVPEFIHDRRFVLLPSDGKTNPTPPTSDDERNRRGRKKAIKLETAGLPEMRRESSPYAWSKPTGAPPSRSSGEFFLSPDNITPVTRPSFPSIPRSAPTSATSQPPPLSKAPTSAPRAQPTVDRPSYTYESFRQDPSTKRTPSPHTRAATTTPKEDHRRSISRHERTGSARNSYGSPDLDVNDPPFVKDHDDIYHPRKAESHVSNQIPRSTPPSQQRARHSRHASEARSEYDSRESTPRSAHASYPPSPPRSPHPSYAPPSLPPSRPVSQSTSAYSSPQPSPYLLKSALAAEALWGSSSATHQPRQSSRLSSTNAPDSTHTSRSASSNYSTPMPPVLPYPDDDRLFQSMPSEKDHIFVPLGDSPRSVSQPDMPSSTLTASTRPNLSTRNSAVLDPTQLSTSPRYSRPVSPHITTKPRAPAQLKVLARSLPHCPRQRYSGDYEDWYTIEGCPGFDICPTCLETVFGNTTYRSSFRPSPTRALIGKGLQVKCDFADAWVRLAWLLTVQRELPSLELIKIIVNLSPPDDSDQACPGAAEEVRDWYSIRDRDGHFLRGFAVCSTDVKRLRILFPGFHELWQPLPMRASYSHGSQIGGLVRACSLRPALNNRFPQYIDVLVRLHEPSYQAGRMPDASEFVSFVRHKTSLHECTRDDMLREVPWHFIPSLLPAFTVCEDCYDEVVMPAIEADADVAMRFNREAQPIYNEGRFGSSCQLYSPRMRRLFQQAVKENDLKYLHRKALDRKEVEDELQGRVAEIRREARRLKGGSGGYRMSPREHAEVDKLEKELNDLAEQWTKWE